MARAQDVLRSILHAHECFLAFSVEKEHILGIIGYAFPPAHPLRIATTRALIGDPLSAFRFSCDDACCRLCSALGDAAFEEQTAGKACTEFFYGASLRALVAGMPAPQPPQSAKSLTLGDWSRIMDLPSAAQGFMNSARALSSPQHRRKLDACEARFWKAWREEVLCALHHVRIDMSELVVVHMALLRFLPGEIAQLVLRMYARLPGESEDDQPPRKRRRRIGPPAAAQLSLQVAG